MLPALPTTAHFVFMAFDVLHQDGHELTGRRLRDSKRQRAVIINDREASYENKFRRSGTAYRSSCQHDALPSSAAAAEIRVMLSGGFAAAYIELVPEFERAIGHAVSTVRGGSTGTAPNSIPSRPFRMVTRTYEVRGVPPEAWAVASAYLRGC